MALSGTLKDFSIADILQLIGNQQKSGTLVLKNGADEVEIGFIDGNVVGATDASRKSDRFLGRMLVRANLITDQVLEDALSQQKRSLKRLGDILVDLGAIAEADLVQMAQLQTSETAYRLFDWKSGTYEFSQGDVEAGRHPFEPIRAEAILLEGFRRSDEWPAVRAALPLREATLRLIKPLPSMNGSAARSGARLNEHHTRIAELAEPGRALQSIADLSRLGDFEALRSMHELIFWGYLELVAPARGGLSAMKDLAAGGRALARSGWLLRIAVGVACFCAMFAISRQLCGDASSGAVVRHPSAGASSARQLIGRAQQQRLEAALELHKLEHGEYPATLQELVDERLIDACDLRYPFSAPYVYRRSANGFVLLPPLD